MIATAGCAEKPANVVRDVVDEFCRLLGFKAGLYRAAEALGVTERWARGLRAGEPARVDADTYLRALEARRTLRAERRARLLSELAALDAADDETPSRVVLGASNRVGGPDDEPLRRAGSLVRGAVAARGDWGVTR